MPKIFLVSILFITAAASGQTDTSKWVRAFPITGYILDLNDSTQLVQLEMPEGHKINYKQLGVIHGVYKNAHADTASKGYGRCYLIKGDYYYFAIGNNKSGIALKEGDLLYTLMDKTAIYFGRIPKLAAHFIQLQDVYEERLFDRYLVFLKWTENDERALIDSMVKDIQFTGNYFSENDPSMDKEIVSGTYQGRKILEVMSACEPDDVTAFIDYIIARPNLYAGRQWKLSEVFATWLDAGAPMVLK